MAGNDDVIRLLHLPKQVQASESTARPRRSLIAHLQATSGNISAAARLMGVTRAQLHRLAKRHGVDLPSFAKKAKNDERPRTMVVDWNTGWNSWNSFARLALVWNRGVAQRLGWPSVCNEEQ